MSLRPATKRFLPSPRILTTSLNTTHHSPRHHKQSIRWSSVSQAPGSDRVHFPGAVNSKFTPTLSFTNPSTLPAMPTYRTIDADGLLIDSSRPPISVPDDIVLKMYTDMLTVSILDPIMYQAQRQGRLSFYMVSSGEEGIAVGSASALTASDVVFAQYREAGVFQARGFSLDDFMNQLFANRLDVGRGRNMPVHYGSKSLNMHTISSPLATQIPQAAGAAYALKLQHLQNPESVERACVACYFGEGAASEGDFHAALNMAATRACPVVFVCRNNGYAISTPTLEQYRGDGIASRGVGYGIHTIRVDGNDVFAVREVMQRARELALEGDMQPVLVEAMSYRVSHHSTSDDSSKYRPSGEVEAWKRRDNPITRLRKWMENKGLWSAEKEEQAQKEIKNAVMAAFNKAEKEKRPELRAMFEDVYEEVTEEQEEQIEQLKDVIRRYPGEYDVEQFEGGLEGLDKARSR
ncbi:2-oxoisovalerate dehydrogenase subunit alpha [Microthyrium microscopicum]|uniref:2-oxoisovalerate dehydrogenase subunit alpha n=1 Tax=Microthyrium microscopicum TaxID=703497 RepID=A0A6A6UG95_9PEZI|nr:2-oxoisovalerate dehydrogenase subunit alpha [Microthyrium microscopicum]